MNISDILMVIAGLILLIAGGEALVRGASTLASKVGLSPLVIGLVVVSAATSAPEFAVTVGAVLDGEPDLAVGNVVGSNIVNILVILGISAIISPLVIRRQLIRFDIPVMVGLSLLLVLVSLDGRISVFDGMLLLATGLGVSSLVIGLTVVALGTSLPELATSIIAIRRGERDMAVGNIVGSNLFNIGLVLGLPAVIFGQGIPVPSAAIALDLPLMLAAAVALLPIAFTGFIIARWEGVMFVALYAAYTLYLVLASTEHDSAQGFTIIMLWFILPLLAVTIIAVTSYEVGLLKGRKERGNLKDARSG